MKTETDTSIVIVVLLGILVVCVALASGVANLHKASIVTLPDGHHVTCVKTAAGGISCDWPGAK